MPDTLPLASLKRRFICLIYEAVLLFGIFFCADFVFDLVTQSHRSDMLRHGRQLYLFVIVGVYFTYFWRRTGQTLAMQTWRIQMVSTSTLRPPTFWQAWLRYVAAWMWVLPALIINDVFQIKEWASVVVVLVGLVAWAMTSFLDKQGQFLHDRLAGTRCQRSDIR
jgi:uncharacterized RDD family membrane protein YckC